MSLTCECDWDAGPEVFREKIVRAKKQHVCCECRKEISPGEDYEYVFGVWHGEAQSFHTCETCSDLRASLNEHGFCCNYGDLKYEHQEYIEHYVKQ